MAGNLAAPGQKGFALLEITIALLIAGLVAVWGSQALVNRFNDAEAQAAAVWMQAVHKATVAFIRRHGPDIQAAATPAQIALEGYADWSAPTLAELKHAGLLSPGFPTSTRLTGEARIDVWRGEGCPGDDCSVEALIHGRRPLFEAGRNAPREALVAQWLLAAEGQGAAVHASDPTRIRGTAFAFSSILPDGSVLPVGTVGMAVTAEYLALWDFLRVRDRRDPDFQNDMTLAGKLVLHSQHIQGDQCEPEYAVAHDMAGGLLVCRHGQWRSSSRSGGGGYAYNSVYGCETAEGISTANPITGQCSCPWFATPVRLLEVGSLSDPQGKQFAYLCVG